MNQPTTMNELLAQHYGTNGHTKVASAPSPEDLEKAAQMDLFAKMAAANNIDMSKLSDVQIEQLYNETFSKTAGEMPPQFAAHAKGKGEPAEKDEKKEIEEKAKKEHEEKKEAMAKAAEADWVGRQMAHAYVQELGLIAENLQKTAAAGGAPLAAPPAAGAWTVEIPKLASAIDTLAISRAFEMIQEFNKTAAPNAKIDEKLAAEYIVAAHTKGLGDSTKVASAVDHKAAVEVRALETLEAIGLKVNWT